MQISWKSSLVASLARKASVVLVFLGLPFFCFAQTKPIPVIDAKTLNGETVNLPETASGKPLVLVFGFGRSSKSEGETWGKELVSMYLGRNNFDFYQVAILDGAPRFTHGLITRAIRAAVPTAYYSHMLLLTENAKAWRNVLDVTDDESTYVVLCSPTGEIQWQTRGAGQAQFDALRAQLHKDAD
jgi:hypothetical protein